MNRSRLVVACALMISLIAAPSFGAAKAGERCSKAGSTATAGGKKYTCIKSGTKLVWNKGVAIAKPAPKVTPTPIPTSTPSPEPRPTSTPSKSESEAPFVPWSSNTSARAVSDMAQSNFRKWAESQNSALENHKLIVQGNVLDSRKNNFQSVDRLGVKLFGQYFTVPSATVIGSDEKWVVDRLNSNGGSYKDCSENAGNNGLNYCHDGWKTQGYVVTADMGYDATYPGTDGTSLLAHEYFHLVQSQLSNSEKKGMIKGGGPQEDHAFPVWLIEGSANFVGFSVSALAFRATYWEGRKAMFSYAPPGDAINAHALQDYEIRNGPGNYSPTYPYIVGQVATEYLVASVGFEKLLEIFKNNRETNNFKKSFQDAIGITLEDFYAKFENVRTKLGLPPVSYKLICLTSYRLNEIPLKLPPCALDEQQTQNKQNQPGNPPPPPPPPGSEPPPIDRTSNVDGLGCRNKEPDLVNGFGTFVCTESPGGNNLWRRKN